MSLADIFGIEYPAWTEQALCAQVDPELWFPDKGGSTREAKAICAQCPVRRQCLDYALQNGDRFGVYGGTSERERRKMTTTLTCALTGCEETFQSVKGGRHYCCPDHSLAARQARYEAKRVRGAA